MADTLASFNRRVERFEKELTDDALGHAIGKMAKEEASAGANADLTNADFSGWRRGGPIKLDTGYNIVGRGQVQLKPTPKSAGPWTVLSVGRNAGDASIGPMQGPTLTKTGKVSRAKRKRWNGSTKGKGTADKVHAEIEKKAPKVVDVQIAKAINKIFS